MKWRILFTGEMLVTNPKTKEVFILTGSRIQLWICLDGTRSIRQLSRATTMPVATIQTLLTDFARHGMLGRARP